MRLFVAVRPPLDVIEDLDAFLDPRREAGTDLRWSDPDRLHLTLAFMAKVPDRSLERLIDELATACAGRTAPAVHLAGGTAFPSPYAAKVLVADAADPGGHLSGLARAVRQAATHAGAPVDGRRFHPHITVARARRPVEATRYLRVLATYESPGWVADEVELIRSHLGERGRPRYETVAHLALGVSS